ncbi:unnamed protein product [Pleuronectes platessa]|uniref:Uncharacterized protein n=1 Tax=Pleuronectes platessa TaxID=8262 RepID=A0A9N7VTH9_PLEPL|nr:unnamed protein product [Pleuronectes platessa]
MVKRKREMYKVVTSLCMNPSSSKSRAKGEVWELEGFHPAGTMEEKIGEMCHMQGEEVKEESDGGQGADLFLSLEAAAAQCLMSAPGRDPRRVGEVGGGGGPGGGRDVVAQKPSGLIKLSLIPPAAAKPLRSLVSAVCDTQSDKNRSARTPKPLIFSKCLGRNQAAADATGVLNDPSAQPLSQLNYQRWSHQHRCLSTGPDNGSRRDLQSDGGPPRK